MASMGRRLLALLAVIGMGVGPGTSSTGYAEQATEATETEGTRAQGKEPQLGVTQPGEEVREVASAMRERPRHEAIEEITVTARRREEHLQDAPLSVTALGVEDLAERSVTRLEEISQYVPNLQLGGRMSAVAYIRGVGSGDGIVTRDPGVGIYLDGVYLARAQGSLLSMADIGRVEVLRGPQGTLYGRNTIGGAVNLITQKPGPDLAASLRVRYGNYDNVETRTVLNVPLLEEKAYARLSFRSHGRDGYWDNLINDEDANDAKFIGGRAALRFLPTDTLTIDLTGDFTIEHFNNVGGHCVYNDTAPAHTGFLPNGVPFGSLNRFMNLPPISFRDKCLASQGLDADDLEYFSQVGGEMDLDTQGLSGTLTWDVSDRMTAKLISSWRRQENKTNTEHDYTGAQYGNTTEFQKDQSDQFGYELNLSGSALGERLQWTMGGYAFHEKSDPAIPMTKVATDIGMLPPLEPIALNFSYSERNWIKNNNFAAYGQFTYDLTDQLSLTAGVRRLVEKKRWKHRRHSLTGDWWNPSLGPIQISVGQDGVRGTEDDRPLDLVTTERFDAWTGLVNLRYRLTDDAIGYAQWASGYKSGGFNGRTNPNAPATLEEFDPEELDNYEVGLKSAWLDSRLIFNLAAFHSRYEEIQQTVLSTAPDGSFASVVRNAGKATMRGGEVELRALPIPGLDLRAAIGIVDAKYEENFRRLRWNLPGPDGFADGFVCGNGVAPDPPECADLEPGTSLSSDDDLPNFVGKHDEFFNLPNYTLNFSASYTLDTPLGELTPWVSWYHQSKIHYAPDSDVDFAEQGKAGVLGARLTLALNDGDTEIALWGTNLLDRRYLSGVTNFNDGFAVTDQYYAPPRMYGIEISRRFGGL